MDSSCTTAENIAVKPVSTGHEMHDRDEPSPGKVATMFPMNTCTKSLAGYANCAEEAIRFLIEEEGLPCSHPTVLGLYDHLSEDQKLLHVQYLLSSVLIQDQHVNGDCADVQNEADEDRNSAVDAGEVTEIGKTPEVASHSSGPIVDTEELAVKIAKELLSLLQEGDFSGEDEDLVDEGYTEYIEL